MCRDGPHLKAEGGPKPETETIVAERLTILNGRFYMDEGLLNQKTGIGPSGRYNQTAPPSARGGHCEARETAETVGHLCERPKVPTKTSAVPTAVRRVEPRATTRTDVTLESFGPARPQFLQRLGVQRHLDTLPRRRSGGPPCLRVLLRKQRLGIWEDCIRRAWSRLPGDVPANAVRWETAR